MILMQSKVNSKKGKGNLASVLSLTSYGDKEKGITIDNFFGHPVENYLLCNKIKDLNY